MKKKNMLCLLSALTVASLLAGCGTQTTEPGGNDTPTQVETKQEESIEVDEKSLDITDVSAKDYVNYTHAINIVDSLYDVTPKNTVLSEFSLNMALGLAMQGSDGKTRAEFDNYFSEIPDKAKRDFELYKAYSAYKNVDIHVANGVYIDINNPLQKDFENIARYNYFAGVENMDFHGNPGGTADAINAFCDEHTEHKISEIINELAVSQCDSVLINALYFNGKWDEPFKENQLADMDFTNVDGSVKTVTGMEENGLTLYQSDDTLAFSKMYEGGDFEFIGILPGESICDKNGDFKLCDISFANLIGSPESGKVAHIKMPKFIVEDSNSLTTPLQDEGLTTAFIKGKASNFTKLATIDTCISDVLQKTYVDVSEEGTEAAAVTVIEMTNDACAPVVESVEITLNRPFVFMIYDKINDEILFIGKIVDMNECR